MTKIYITYNDNESRGGPESREPRETGILEWELKNPSTDFNLLSRECFIASYKTLTRKKISESRLI